MRVEKLLKRLKREFVKVNILQASLDALLFFLSLNLFLFLFSLQLIEDTTNTRALAAVSTVFFVGDLIYRSRKYRLEIYEEKNPELHEVLRTARDNLDSKNIVSQALFDDLLTRSRKITSESIIPSKQIIQKAIAVGMLSFLTVISGLVGFNITSNGGEILPNTDSIKEFTGIGGEPEDREFELRNGTEIYGDSRDIRVSEGIVEFDISGEGESESSENLIQGLEPEEIVLDVSEPELSDDLDLAKEYSVAIREMEAN